MVKTSDALVALAAVLGSGLDPLFTYQARKDFLGGAVGLNINALN